MNNLGVFALVFGLVACIGGSATATIPYPYVEWISEANTEEVSIFILPDGSGPALTEAMAYGGQTMDATISLRLIDCFHDPIATFPWEDIWIETEVETSISCPSLSPGVFHPDGPTNASGEGTFSLPLSGGGWTEGPIWVYVLGNRALYAIDCSSDTEHPPLSLRFNSADINGDGTVDLADVSLFAGDYFGEYQYRSDFFWDGVLNLSDLAPMASGFGITCE